MSYVHRLLFILVFKKIIKISEKLNYVPIISKKLIQCKACFMLKTVTNIKIMGN